MFDFAKQYMGHSGRFRAFKGAVRVLYAQATDESRTARIVHLGISRQRKSHV
jgi:hypothetical protein